MLRLACSSMLLILALMPGLAYAQTGPLTTDPPALTVTGTLEHGVFAASLRLIPNETLTEVRIFVTDLLDATGDNVTRDPLPSSAVTLLPATEFITLTPSSLTQILVQVMPPPAAGTYTGTLLIRWTGPEPGQQAVPVTVVARTRPVLALQGITQVSLNGVEGGEITRQITLQETTGKGSPLTGLRAVPQDLVTTDGHTLEASQMRVAMPADQIEGGDILTSTLTVDLDSVPAGAYGGEILFKSDAGNLVALPVTVNVRHGWPIPALVLVMGVALGLCLSNYQTRGRLRDKLIVRMVAVRKAMEYDAHLKDGFGPRLDPLLSRAEASIRTEQWEEAKSAVQTAEGLVRKWKDAPETWSAQLDYLSEALVSRLKGEALTQRRLRQQAEDAQTGAADFESPSALRSRLLEIEQELVSFADLKQRLEEIGKARTNSQLPMEAKEKWRIREKELARQLGTLLPDNVADWKQLEDDVQALGQEVIEQIQAYSQETADRTEEAVVPEGMPTARGLSETAAQLSNALQARVPAGSLLPEVGPMTSETATAARQRLRVHTTLVYGLGGLLLAALGFNNLYLDQPTFGAKPVLDYLALLGWGLGAQTTFTSVAGLLRNWGVPMAKEE